MMASPTHNDNSNYILTRCDYFIITVGSDALDEVMPTRTCSNEMMVFCFRHGVTRWCFDVKVLASFL